MNGWMKSVSSKQLSSFWEKVWVPLLHQHQNYTPQNKTAMDSCTGRRIPKKILSSKVAYHSESKIF